MIIIQEEFLEFIIPVVVVVLILVLLYRLKRYFRILVKNEIYDHFPTIKQKIEEYERKIELSSSVGCVLGTHRLTTLSAYAEDHGLCPWMNA